MTTPKPNMTVAMECEGAPIEASVDVQVGRVRLVLAGRFHADLYTMTPEAAVGLASLLVIALAALGLADLANVLAEAAETKAHGEEVP